MNFKTELENAAYQLAMLGLQSPRYVNDPDYKDAVDAVLHMTLLRDVNSFADAPQCTTIVHPGTEPVGSRCVLRAGHDGKCQPTSKHKPRTLQTDLLEDR